MEYHDQPLQYKSHYTFQAKGTNNANHHYIALIITVMTYLPTLLMPLATYLVSIYIYPFLISVLQEKEQVFFACHGLNRRAIALLLQWKLRLCYLSVLYTLFYIVYHIISTIERNFYGNEVLDDSYYKALIAGSLLSTFAIVTAFLFTIRKCFQKIMDPLAVSLSLNVIYLLSYFSPAIFLAFMHNPLHITFLFLLRIIYIFGWLMFVSSKFVIQMLSKGWAFCAIALVAFLVDMLSYCIFLLVSFIIALGGFHDFQVFLTLLLSIIIGLFSIPKVFKNKSMHESLKEIVITEANNRTITTSRVYSNHDVCISQQNYRQIHIKSGEA